MGHQLLAPGRSPKFFGCRWSHQSICWDTNQARYCALCDTNPNILQQPAGTAWEAAAARNPEEGASGRTPSPSNPTGVT